MSGKLNNVAPMNKVTPVDGTIIAEVEMRPCVIV